MTEFEQLNRDWNADPNTPFPEVKVDGRDCVLTFWMNHYLYPAFKDDDIGVLRFSDCRQYRLGSTNDEGWYLGQCRFSKLAPDWGEFYEVKGDLLLDDFYQSWTTITADESETPPLLYFLRDVKGDVPLRQIPEDWVVANGNANTTRHFLFYFRDETFECDAADWSFTTIKAGDDRRTT